MVTEQSQPMLHLLVHLYIKDKNACTAQELLHRGDHWFTFPQVEAAGGATFTEGVLSYSHIGLQMWLSWKKHRVDKTNKSFLCPAFPFLSFCILPIWKRSYVHRWEDTKASFLSHLTFTKHSFASSAFFFLSWMCMASEYLSILMELLYFHVWYVCDILQIIVSFGSVQVDISVPNLPLPRKLLVAKSTTWKGDNVQLTD